MGSGDPVYLLSVRAHSVVADALGGAGNECFISVNGRRKMTSEI